MLKYLSMLFASTLTVLPNLMVWGPMSAQQLVPAGWSCAPPCASISFSFHLPASWGSMELLFCLLSDQCKTTLGAAKSQDQTVIAPRCIVHWLVCPEQRTPSKPVSPASETDLSECLCRRRVASTRRCEAWRGRADPLCYTCGHGRGIYHHLFVVSAIPQAAASGGSGCACRG